MRLTRLLYYSENRLEPGDRLLGALQDILRTSKRNNALCGVSGALAFDDFWFLQALEGPRETLWSLLMRIMEDARHDNVALVEFASIDKRAFGAWSMRLVKPSPTTTTPWAPFIVDGLLRPALMSGDDMVAALLQTIGTGSTTVRSVASETRRRDKLPRTTAIAP